MNFQSFNFSCWVSVALLDSVIATCLLTPAIALVRVAEPIALTSIVKKVHPWVSLECISPNERYQFPYAWKFILHFNIGDKTNASFYAGVLIATFSFAESLTGIFWGSLSDRIGRKPVLLLGSAGTALSLIIVGFSSNLWMALAGRMLGGLLNGNVGVAQSMVSELVKRPEHEPRAYSVLPFVWSIGTIIGPAIGGLFSEPHQNFPSHFSQTGIFAAYPYLLPNVICTFILCTGILLGYFLIQETHPDFCPEFARDDSKDAVAETPLLMSVGAADHVPVDLRSDVYGTFINEDTKNEGHWTATFPDGESCTPVTDSALKPLNKQVIMLIIGLGIFTYHSMTFDHLLPIYLQDDRASSPLTSGLGLSTQKVGLIMSVNGLVAMFVQGVIFPMLASLLSLQHLFFFVTLLHPLTYLLMPLLALLPLGLVTPGIYGALFVRNLLSIIAYPIYLIFLKDAAPASSCLGRINGLAASTGAACRTLASPLAGLLYGVGVSRGFAPLPWLVSAAVAVVGAVQVCMIDRRYGEKTPTCCIVRAGEDASMHNKQSVVRVLVPSVSNLSNSD